MYDKGFDNQSVDTLRQWIAEARRVVLVSHVNADGDACGSLLGTTLMLDQAAQAEKITPLLPNGCPRTMGWLPQSARILSGNWQHKQCRQQIAEADLLVYLDLNCTMRTDALQNALMASTARKVLIDHHHDPAVEQFDLVFSDPLISSTCELVLWLSEQLWGKRYLTPEVATCLYTGLRTDTGGFAFSCNQPSAFEAAAQLVELGADPAIIHIRLADNFTFHRMRFYGFALSERLRIFPQQHTALFAFSMADQQRFGVDGEDMEGLVNYTLMMEEIAVGALLREEEGRTKVSLRAKGDSEVDVNRLAQQLGGGGHTKAAGATCYKPFADTLAAVERLLGLSESEELRINN